MNGQLGKVLYYAIRVEFQARGSPHVHCLLWTSDMPQLNKETKDEYVNFIDTVISANMPDKNIDENLHRLVKTFQVHYHSKTCKKYKNNECRFNFGHFFSKKTIIAEPISPDISASEKSEILNNRNKVLDKVQACINENLNPKKVNFLDSNKPDFVCLDSCEHILSFLGITLDEYEHALSISKDNDF